jgi:general L-amino acid transport system substrate-binding protein
MNKLMLTGVFGAAALAMASSAAFAATLDDVKAKGFVQCGVSQGLPGFSNPDDKNNWTGLDVDLCRAVAAASSAIRPEGKVHPAVRQGALHRAAVR